jgi:colicin import membrane protein
MFKYLASFILTRKKAFFFALTLHLIVLFVIIFSKITQLEPSKTKQIEKVEIVKAVSVDLDLVKKEKKRLLDIKKAKKNAKAQEIKQHNETLEKLKRKQKEAEKKRFQALKDKKKAELAKIKFEKEKKVLEVAKRKALAQKKKAEKEKNKALAQKKKANIERKKAEKAKRKALAEKRKALAGKNKANKERRKAEKARKKALAEKEKTDKKRKLAKELANELAEDEKLEREVLATQQLNKLKIGYISQIATKVQNNWRRLPKTKKGWQCYVVVLQNKKGVVKTVVLKKCSGGSAFQRSVKAAVFKASPLPKAPQKDIFDKEISFIFEVR